MVLRPWFFGQHSQGRHPARPGGVHRESAEGASAVGWVSAGCPVYSGPIRNTVLITSSLEIESPSGAGLATTDGRTTLQPGSGAAYPVSIREHEPFLLTIFSQSSDRTESGLAFAGIGLRHFAHVELPLE